MTPAEIAGLIMALDMASTNIIKLVMDLSEDTASIEDAIAQADIEDSMRKAIMDKIRAH